MEAYVSAMKLFAIAVLLLVGGAMLWVRLAPTSPEAWHVDPSNAADPGRLGVLEEVKFAAPPEAVMSAIEAVAANTPRTKRIAGDPGDGFVTYVSRSLIWGFPDYVTIKADAIDGDATQLVILSRLRFGGYDQGVNAERVKDWLAQVEALLPS